MQDMGQHVEAQFLRPGEIIAIRNRRPNAFLPVGPLEWHGPHLPLGVDPVRAELAAKWLCRRIGGVVLPTLYVGTERERPAAMLKSIGFQPTDYVVGMDFPAVTLKSLYFREEVFAVVLREQVRLVIEEWKFRNVIIVNGHGAENHLNVIGRLQREFNETTAGRVLWVMPMFNFPNGAWSHAALEETETLMAYYPETIDLGALPPARTKLKNLKWAIIDDLTFRGTPTRDFTVRPEEDPRGADRKRGRKVFARTLTDLKKLLLKQLAER